MYKYDEKTNDFFWSDDEEVFQLPQIAWHITNFCSLDCIYCFSDKTNEELNIRDLDMYISKLKYLNVQKIDISGGEPLQYRNLDVLCEKLVNEGFVLTITTTGVGTNKNIYWLVNNCFIFSRIILSIDVGNCKKQDDICNTKNVLSYTNYLHDAFVEKGYKNIRINTVATRYLLDKYELEKLSDYISSMNVKEWCMIEYFPVEDKKAKIDFSISRDQFIDILNNIKRYVYKSNKIKVFYRSIEDFNGYWVLHPNGEIMQRSYGLSDTVRFSLKEMEHEEIKNKIKKEYINFPGKR